MEGNMECIGELITGYINKCIKDDYKTENREYDDDKISFFYAILELPKPVRSIKKEIHLFLTTQYERVTRKVIYRFRNNVEKNFGILPGDYYNITKNSVLQHAFVCNKFIVQKGNKTHYYYIDNYNPENHLSGKVLPDAGRHEKLVMTYYDLSYDDYTEDTYMKYSFPSEMEWDEYKKLYEKAFGKTCQINILHMEGSKNISIKEI